MTMYENSYFRLRLDFPETWKLTSWRHAKISRSWRLAYQARDDDLPRKGKRFSKFLFTAALHPAEIEALVDVDIELSVFRLSPGEDMRTSLLENFERERDHFESNGIVRTILGGGTWNICRMGFTYVDVESKSRRGHSRYRFFFRPHDEVFWLYGKIAGHNGNAYQEALKIVEGLKSTIDGTG